ncbi:hypothetical protein SCHPADRAFT_636599 [Schizopora paradoxa]|uniref:Uncharacterized protein n=1 Tax=Schizopora paradoxa TaxID=27342 RepID=A0A0H2R8M4_9AGAM|nr:hypothetical protein SCHPADRAFT_636599 [Schizopora paradoxa]
MGWRKVGNDGRELCGLLDYLFDGLKTLKTSIQMGRRLDGKDEMRVNLKELWCDGLHRHSASDDKTIHVKNAKIAFKANEERKIAAVVRLKVFGRRNPVGHKRHFQRLSRNRPLPPPRRLAHLHLRDVRRNER